MKSQNSIILTGRLTADAKELANNAGVSFSIAHNMGKNNDPLYVDFTFFTKNGNRTVNIPTELLKKGQAVTVSAWMKPDNYVNADGKKIRHTQYIVKKVEAIDPETADEQDENEE